MTSSGMTKFFTSFRKSPFRKVLADPFGFAGFFLVVLIVFIALFAPVLAPYPPDAINVYNKLAGPSAEHILGTDHLGRDLLSRIVYGARIALLVSLTSTTFAVVLGVILGIIAGYSSSRVDSILVTFFDIIRSFPSLLFAIAIIAMVGTSSMATLIVIIGFTNFPRYARLIRVQTFRVKEKEFIMASKVIGTPSIYIMARHIFPNVVGPMFINVAMDIPAIIAFEAGLSFLGLGVPPPTPSWGSILRYGYLHIRSTPWMVINGGLALVLATLGFTLLGEALRDVFDPKLRKNQ